MLGYSSITVGWRFCGRSAPSSRLHRSAYSQTCAHMGAAPAAFAFSALGGRMSAWQHQTPPAGNGARPAGALPAATPGMADGFCARANRYDRGPVKRFFQTKGLRVQRTGVYSPLSSGGEKPLTVGDAVAVLPESRPRRATLPTPVAVEGGESRSYRYSGCPP